MAGGGQGFGDESFAALAKTATIWVSKTWADEGHMTEAEIDEIIAILPKGRTYFHYFPDRFAAIILGWRLQKPVSIAALRKEKMGKLLGRPLIANLLAKCGDGQLTRERLDSLLPETFESYRLTLGRWGPQSRSEWYDHWHQTSRPGGSLVLRLNFSEEHNAVYHRLIGYSDEAPLRIEHHAAEMSRLNTLAWARLDIDLQRGEALIEEIQNDWLRLALTSRRNILAAASNEELRRALGFLSNDRFVSRDDALAYLSGTLAIHQKIWSEAMLSAALWFLVEEIGIRKIFMHTFDCGIRLKNIADTPPPRSLYTRLPKTFCFEQTTNGPEMLEEAWTTSYRILKWSRALRFWRLDV
jgi:hypothetical protein